MTLTKSEASTKMLSEFKSLVQLEETVSLDVSGEARLKELEKSLVKDIYTRTEKIIFLLRRKPCSDTLSSVVIPTWGQMGLSEAEMWLFWTMVIPWVVGMSESNDIGPGSEWFHDLLRTIGEFRKSPSKPRTRIPQIYIMIEKATELVSDTKFESQDYSYWLTNITKNIFSRTIDILGDTLAKETYGQLWVTAQLLSMTDPESVAPSL